MFDSCGESLLVEILPRMTSMPVVRVADWETVKANQVDVVPAGNWGPSARNRLGARRGCLGERMYPRSGMANGRSAKRMWGGASAPRGDGAGPTPVRCGSRSIRLQLKLR